MLLYRQTHETATMEEKCNLVPFPYMIIDNYISREDCSNLINDAGLMSNSGSMTHGGRAQMFSSSDNFKHLLRSSKSWRKIQNKLRSEVLLKMAESIEKKSEKPKDMLFITKSLRKWKVNRNFYTILEVANKNPYLRRKIKSLGKILEKNVGQVGPSILFSIGALDLIDKVYRNTRDYIDNMLGCRRLTLVIDYSRAFGGYKFKPHRDSDSRQVVFLLFLNSLEKNVEGGALEFYKYNQNKSKYAPTPELEDISIFESIKPAAGRLVVFINTSNAYHGVSELAETKVGRHFIYGGYTAQTSLKSISCIRSSGRLPTEYYMNRGIVEN